MPTPDELHDRRQAAKAEILRRVAIGETISAAARAMGGPHPATVSAWAAGDPAFAAELAEARRCGAERRRDAFDEDRARVVVTRLWAGAALRDLVREPGMPSLATVRRWRATDRQFAADLDWALSLAREQRGRNLRTRPGGVPPYDAAVADRVLAAVCRGAAVKRLAALDPAFPSYRTLRAWVRADPEFAFALRACMPVARAARCRIAALAVARPLANAMIYRQASLRRLSGRAGLPPRRTVSGWMARWPEFREAVAKAAEEREAWRRSLLADELAGPPCRRLLARARIVLSGRRGVRGPAPGQPRPWR